MWYNTLIIGNDKMNDKIGTWKDKDLDFPLIAVWVSIGVIMAFSAYGFYLGIINE